MRCGKKTLVVLLASTPALLCVLHWGIINFHEERPATSDPVDIADQQEAAEYMKSAIQGFTDQLLKDFPEDPDLILMAGELYNHTFDYLKTMRVLENGLKYNPNNFALNHFAFRVAFDAGKFERATPFGYKALAIEPKSPVVYEEIADALIFSGQYQQAVDLLEGKLQAFGGSVRSYWLLGKCHLLSMNYEAAKDYYTKAYQKDPSVFQKDPSLMPMYLSNMAKIHMKLKQPEEAKQYMKRHGETSAERSIQTYQKFQDELSERHSVDLQFTYSELRFFSMNLAPLCIRGTQLYTQRRDMKAAQQLLDDACSIFEKTIAIAPGNAALYRELARLLYKTAKKEPGRIQKLAKKAVALEGSALNYYVLGNAYLNNSNPKKAAAAYKRALELDPENQIIKQAYNSAKERRQK